MDEIKKLSNVIVEFYEKLSSWENAVVADSGLSLPQMHTIEILGINGPLKMKELANKVGVTTGTLTVTIDKLEKKEIVVRTANPDDRRSFVIELTEKGKQIQEEHSHYHLNLTRECTTDFNNDDKTKFLGFIEKFMNHF